MQQIVVTITTLYHIAIDFTLDSILSCLANIITESPTALSFTTDIASIIDMIDEDCL